jgi:DNA-binding FadR family transcriptional regulator
MQFLNESGMIRVPKAAELVANRIQRAIVTGRLKDGQCLPPESRLMEAFQVSRPTVRVGIRVLESLGLVTVGRGARGGARVTTPDSSVVASAAAMALQIRGATIADLFDAHTLLEPGAARHAAERRPKAAAAALRAHVERELAVIDDFPAVARAISEFHTLLLEECGNETLAVFGSALKNLFDRAMLAAQPTVTTIDEAHRLASLRYGLRSHRKLADLIESGDGDAAEAHWKLHVTRAGKVWLKSVGATDVIDLFR